MGAYTRFLWAAVITFVAWCGWATSAHAYVYWTNQGSNTIGRANLDGSGANHAFIRTYGTPRGVAVNDRYIYWADATSNWIGRANLDGSDPTPWFKYVENPSGIAIVGEHIFWTTAGSNWVARADLDGSNEIKNYMFLARPHGLTTDGKRLFAGSSANGGGIWGGSFNSPAEGIERIRTGVTVETSPAADDAYLYWPSPHTASIGRSGQWGSAANTSFITGASDPRGVAVDDDHVYWTNHATNTIGRAKLDGTEIEPSFITGANRPLMMAVDDRGPSPARMSVSPGALFTFTQPVGTIGRSTAITVRNSGYGELEIDSVRLQGDEFLLAGDDCSRASLKHDESCEVKVRFAPTETGFRFSTLEIRSNNPVSPWHVSLGGEGIAQWGDTAVSAPDHRPTFSAAAAERTAATTTTAASKPATFRLITCKPSARRCTQRVMTADTTFATTGKARASLKRRGAVYATGTATAKRLVLRARRAVQAGRYTLVLRHGKRVTARTPITLR